MRKLICAKDIEAMVKNGEHVLYVDANTIVTPSAKDMLHVNGIVITDKPQAVPVKEPQPAQNQPVQQGAPGGSKIDSETIYSVLKAMMEKGMLSGLLDCECEQKPYTAEYDPCGFKLVRGNTARLDVLDTGNQNDKAFYQELIGSGDHSSMNAGFMTIERSNFDWDVTCEEIYYIIEGTLTITIDGKTFVARPGDSLYAPKGSKVAWGSPDKVKVFYATF